MSDLTTRLATERRFIPAVPPPGGAPPRTRPTTQVLVSVEEWPGNTFRLWAPENVGTLWRNWEPAASCQEFVPTEQGGLIWTARNAAEWEIESELMPLGSSLTVETRVTNRSADDLDHVSVTNCIQFRLAPDFACDDFSRIYMRTGGEWVSLASLQPSSDYPHYYRAGQSSGEGTVGWGGNLAHLFEDAEAKHPLMVCVSKDGARSVATAAEGYEYLFHNRGNKELLCIHSTQAPRETVAPGETAVFRQRAYFVEGGVDSCAEAFEADQGH